MKKFFIMLGCWFAVIITVIVGSAVYEKIKTSEYDDAAVPYLEKVIPEISRWDVQRTRQLMAPEAISKIPEDKFAGIINYFSKMGTLKGLETPRFSKVQSEAGDGSGQGTIIEYTVDAHYTNGDAQLTINLLHEDGLFKVYHFNLSSDIMGR